MHQNQYYKTASFYTSVFLIIKNCELVGVEGMTDSKKIFVFNKTPKLQELVQVFNFGKEEDDLALVDARKIGSAIKKLKNALYQ